MLHCKMSEQTTFDVTSRLKRENAALKVKLVSAAKQQNGNDCGVYATAFAFEWLLHSVQTNLNINFTVNKMRQHLVQCLEKNLVAAFPRRGGRCRKAVAAIEVVLD